MRTSAVHVWNTWSLAWAGLGLTWPYVWSTRSYDVGFQGLIWLCGCVSHHHQVRSLVGHFGPVNCIDASRDGR
jgi:hypothetical protein